MSESTKKAKPVRCVVTSDKMNKSRVGTVERLVRHPHYNKYVRRRTKVHFHDEENQTSVGDEVLVTHSRPRSATKKFELQQILRRASE